MNQLLLAPILIPACSAVLLLFLARRPLGTQRAIGLLATALSTAAAIALLSQTLDGSRHVVSMGDWPIPHGIVFVLDRLSAAMLVLTGALALGAIGFATRGWDAQGRNFHALFQFQMMGIHGAFLTGDLFNLFVFFEILLISSYGLLLHGGGRERIRAGLRYVVVNLVGSTLFVMALALVYGSTGTLNMAALASGRFSGAVWTVAVLMLLVVFSIKAAAVPLQFWLPGAYGAAAAPVACLFAILTKVGVYAILRVHGLVLGLDGVTPLLLGVGAVGVLVGAVGALASQGLRDMLGWLVVSSVSTALLAIGVGGSGAIAAALYYTLHSTLVTGALFLLADTITTQRGSDGFSPGPPLARQAWIGAAFLVGAAAFAGLPPTSGFLGKLSVLTAIAGADVPRAALFATVLGGGLVGLVGLSRAGSALFWNLADDGDGAAPPAPLPPWDLAPAGWLLGLGLALSVGAGPVTSFLGDAADQVLDTASYSRDVFATRVER